MKNTFRAPKIRKVTAKMIRGSIAVVKCRIAANRAYVKGMNELMIANALSS